MNIDKGWGELMKGSINGFFTIVVSLAWWALAVNTAAQHKVLLDMLDDVTWVLDQMVAKLGGIKKQGQHDDTTEQEQDV